MARRGAEKAFNIFSSSRYEYQGNPTSAGIFGTYRNQSFSNLPISRFRTVSDYLDTYAQLSAVYTCTNQIANSIAGLPLTFTDATGKAVATLGQEVAKPGSLAYLLENPNPYQDYHELMETTVAHMELTGNAIWLLEDVDGRGRPVAIYPLNPALIRMVIDPQKGLIGYIYRLGAYEMPLGPEDVLHFRYANPSSMFWGQGTLAALTGALDSEINIADSVRALYQNGAVVPGAFVADGSLSPTQFERMKEQFRQEHTGVANWFTPLVLEGGVKWQNMTVGHAGLGTIDFRKWSKEEIFETFGVPMSEVGNQGRANVKNDHLTDNYWLNTITPKTRRIVARLKKLASAYDPNIGITMPVPVKPNESELLDNAGKVDALIFLTTREKRTIYKALLGQTYGLEDMQEDLPIEEFPLAPPPPPEPPAAPPAPGEGQPTGELPAPAGAGAIKQPSQQDLSGNNAGVTNFTDLTVEDDTAEAKSFDLALDAETETGEGGEKATGQSGPGSRGGNYWIDKNGKVRYGQKPVGPDARAARVANRAKAKLDLTDPATGKQFKDIDDIRAKGWQTPFPDMEEITDKNQAIDTAQAYAKINPDYMFLIVKSNGAYYVVSKGIRDLPKLPPKKKPEPSNAPIQTNIGAATKKKPKPAGKADSATANHTGVMVAFMLPQDKTQALAATMDGVKWPKGSEVAAPEELHMTLAYLGDSAELDYTYDRVLSVLEDFCKYNRAITGTIAGVGRFNTTEEGNTEPIWAAFDGPGLAELRTGLVSALNGASEVEVISNHGFTPHITLAYVPKESKTPDITLDSLEITFDAITLCWGDEHYPVMLLDSL